MTIRAENICVRIGRKKLLDDISLTVETGELVAVVGANGAGKSTLLKSLCGEIRPTSGEVFFGERRLNDWPTEELAKIRAVLPQSFALNFPFKVREVTLLGRTPHIGFTETPRDYQIVGEALAMVEAAEFAERYYPTLSGGEKQRVQIARVLAQIWDSDEKGLRYLLLDEPTSSLDLAHQHLILETAGKLAGERTAVVAVLHDLNLAAQYADKILMLKDGKCFAFGEPRAVLNSQNIREAFGIDVYITKHAKNYDVPLIVPIGKATANGKALSAGN